MKEEDYQDFIKSINVSRELITSGMGAGLIDMEFGKRGISRCDSAENLGIAMKVLYGEITKVQKELTEMFPDE